LSDSAFAQALVKKGERALATANTNLREGDMDGAVNRAYYAMSNIARAALLRAGIPESELPRSQTVSLGHSVSRRLRSVDWILNSDAR
jgi:acetyl-CoA acetyltransferase